MTMISTPKVSVVFTATLLICACVALVAAMHQPAIAQTVVAPSCPQGYELQGAQCVQAAPTRRGGPWVVVTDRALGVRNATELDGAEICVVTGSRSEAALAAYFRTNGMSYGTVAVSSEHAAINGYLDERCDAFLVSDATADATVSDMDDSNNHMILPEIIGRSSTVTPGTVTPTVTVPTQPADLTYPLQAQLKRIGCLTGQVDGIWGNGSRAALGRFAQRSGLNLGTEPSQRALTEAQNRQAGYCPKPKKKAIQNVYRCNNSDYAFCTPIAQEYCEGETGNSCLNLELSECLRNEIGCQP